jgi:translation initiation factor 2-alpha kinase 4
MDPAKVGSHLHLSLQLGKKYPYVMPKIKLQQVQGLSPAEQSELEGALTTRARSMAQAGSVMAMDLVQLAEDFLLAHNCDPTLSAWEQMRERERQQKLQEAEAHQALDQLMDPAQSSQEPAPVQHESLGRPRKAPEVGSKDVERELVRQVEAMEAARRIRNANGDEPVVLEQPADDEDDLEIDLDYNPAVVSASRYETDFEELGILGRGGGGEVVKARNRLDGRIYAIKKILLEPEHGAMAKYGVVHNQKLRREVTTISRVNHSNIVRYYQAWVEGEGIEETDVSVAVAAASAKGPTTFEASTSAVIEEESEEGSGSSTGWWASTPEQKPIAAEENMDDMSTLEGASELPDQESDSMLDIFDNDGGLQSPLLNGLGFQNTMYRDMANRDESSSNNGSDDESVWSEDSSVKVGSSSKGHKIMFIQMEFCDGVLRKVGSRKDGSIVAVACKLDFSPVTLLRSSSMIGNSRPWKKMKSGGSFGR